MIFCRGYVAWIVSRELIFASTNSFSLLKVVLKNWQRKLPTAEQINNPLKKKKNRKNLALRRILSLRLKAKKKKEISAYQLRGGVAFRVCHFSFTYSTFLIHFSPLACFVRCSNSRVI